MSCIPETKFDSFTQMLASGVSRRDAMKWVGAATLGAMLTTAGLKQAEAANPCVDNAPCVGIRCKSCPSGLGCFCFRKANPTSIKSKCLQNRLCAGIPVCTKNKDCVGVNEKCICAGNGCGKKVCLVKCLSCPTGVSGSGTTAAA